MTHGGGEAHLRGFGAAVTVQTWPDAPHVFQLFDGWLPEARDALQSAGAAIRVAAFSPRRPRRSGGS